jgi:hypothetical protein
MNFVRPFSGLIIFLSCNGIAYAQSEEFKCHRAYKEMAPQYPILVCTGNDLLERGRTTDALNFYEKAAQLYFFEAPNFLIYFHIASAQLALNRKNEARETGRNFLSMLDIYDGTKSCAEVQNSNLKAVDVMCDEGFNPEGFKSIDGLDHRRKVARNYREKMRKLFKKGDEFWIQMPTP